MRYTTDQIAEMNTIQGKANAFVTGLRRRDIDGCGCVASDFQLGDFDSVPALFSEIGPDATILQTGAEWVELVDRGLVLVFDIKAKGPEKTKMRAKVGAAGVYELRRVVDEAEDRTARDQELALAGTAASADDGD